MESGAIIKSTMKAQYKADNGLAFLCRSNEICHNVIITNALHAEEAYPMIPT